MTSKIISVSGIDYHTLVEHPSGSSSPGPRGYILLVHAIMSNLHMWDSTVPVLHRAGYSTLRVDHVGHSQSPAPDPIPANYTIDTICQHLHTLSLQLLGQAPSAVVGCSIGGLIALRWGMLFASEGAQVVSLAAPGAKSPDGFSSLWEGRIKMMEEDSRNGGSDRVAKQTVERWLPGDGPLDHKAREEELVRVRGCSKEGYEMLARAISNFDYSHELDKIGRGKCLVIACGRDVSTSPDRLRQTAAEVDGARFKLLQDAGHIPSAHERDAPILNAILLDFLV